MSKKQANSLQVITIVAMMFLYAMIAFVTNLAAPVGKIWESSFKGSNYETVMGMLGNAMNFLAYLAMGIPAGNFLAKRGYKMTALIAIVLGLFGIAVQWLSGICSSFVVYLIGAFLGGVCVCMLNTVTNPMLNLLGGGGKKGNQLNMIGGTINSLTASLTPMLVGTLVGASLNGKTIADVNVVLYIAMAVFALVFLAILLTPIAEPEGAGEKITYERTPWAFRHLKLGVIAIFLYVGVEVGVPAALISYLDKNGYTGYDAATFIAGLYWLLMLVGRTIGSFIGGKVSSRAMVICVSVLAIALMGGAIVLGDSSYVSLPMNWSLKMEMVPVAALMIILVGLCTSVMWTSIFNMATEGLGKYTAKASGIFMMMVVGGGILPLVQSAFGNNLIGYIVPIIAVAYILFYALVGSKNVNKDIKVD